MAVLLHFLNEVFVFEQGAVPEADSLQYLIDESARTGTVVIIPAGVYSLHDSLHLRSGIHIIGHPEAVLTRTPSISSPVSDFLGYGLREIAVADPEKFDIGMGVLVSDDNADGFYTTVATIIGKVGNRFLIDRPLNHDYLPSSNATVTTLFPFFSGIGVEDVVLENLVLDGNPKETRLLNGCRGGGVFLLGSQRVRMRNIEVRHFRGDAISFQQCADVEVRDCHLHHNANCGLHPGSGSVRYIFEGNSVHHNGGDGLFYCLRTTHSYCANNRFEHNGGSGISIGERDTDHLICKNVIAHNAGTGVYFRPALVNGGDHVHLKENEIGPNCLETGTAEIVIDEGLHEIAITENCIQSGDHLALEVAGNCHEIYFAHNNINGAPQKADDLNDRSSSVILEAPRKFPPLGPDALPLDGARHLAIEMLAPALFQSQGEH
jgi:hypothetical protein